MELRKSTKGGNVSYTPMVDALEEFKILTNSFSAEYGRTGGGVIIATIKSGTNGFHGTLFDFLRNDALNARNFFAPRDRISLCCGRTSLAQRLAVLFEKTKRSSSPTGRVRVSEQRQFGRRLFRLLP